MDSNNSARTLPYDSGIAIGAVEVVVRQWADDMRRSWRVAESALRDVLPRNDREFNALCAVPRAGLLPGLLKISAEETYSVLQCELALSTLTRDMGLQPDVAYWVLATWINGIARARSIAPPSLPSSEEGEVLQSREKAGRVGRIGLPSLVLVVLVVIVATALTTFSIEPMIRRSEQPNAQHTPLPDFSNSPETARNRWIATGIAGPVRLPVTANWVISATINTETAMRTVIRLRFGVNNHSFGSIDISDSGGRLVILTDSAPPANFVSGIVSAPYQVRYADSFAPVYAYPMAIGSWTSSSAAGGDDLVTRWSAGSIEVDGNFTGKGPEENCALFIIPELSDLKNRGGMPASLGPEIIGVAYLDANMGLLGLTPPSAWGAAGRGEVAKVAP